MVFAFFAQDQPCLEKESIFRNMEKTSGFIGFLKRIFVPIVAFLYLLSFVVKLHEYTRELGFRILVLTAFSLLALWTVYVWKSRQLTKVEPRTHVPKFGIRVRIASIILVFLGAIPVWWSVHPARPFSIPAIAIRLVNGSDSDITIRRIGEFFLSAPRTPLSDALVAAGRIRLYRKDEESLAQRELVVKAQSELSVFAEIVNSSEYRAFLEAENTSLRVVVFQTDGTMFTHGGVPFDRQTLLRSRIVLQSRQT